jgi:hypothetical protein
MIAPLLAAALLLTWWYQRRLEDRSKQHGTKAVLMAGAEEILLFVTQKGLNLG